MTVLVFGADTPTGAVLAQVDGVAAVGHDMVDMARPADCAALVQDVNPKAVIHAGHPITARIAAADPAFAHTVLGAAPSALAAACAGLDVPMVHLSSPSVFDGALPMAYVPSDGANPDTVLGQAFLAGELGVQQSGGRTATLRASWIFGKDLGTIASGFGIAQARGGWSIEEDLQAAPTPAEDVANALLVMAGALVSQPEKGGIYHFAGDSDISLSGVARYLSLAMDLSDTSLVVAKDTPGGTAKSHRMDCRTTKAVFGLDRPDWRAALSHLKRQSRPVPKHIQQREAG